MARPSVYFHDMSASLVGDYKNIFFFTSPPVVVLHLSWQLVIVTVNAFSISRSLQSVIVALSQLWIGWGPNQTKQQGQTWKIFFDHPAVLPMESLRTGIHAMPCQCHGNFFPRRPHLGAHKKIKIKRVIIWTPAGCYSHGSYAASTSAGKICG